VNQESSPSRVEIIAPLRGLAALAVTWFHLTNGSHLLSPESWLRQSGSYGWLGVEVFFVISGFVIPLSMHRGSYAFPGDVGTFLAKRIVRLDPPYLIAVALGVGLWYVSSIVPGFMGSAPTISAAQVAAHIGYVTALLGYPWLSPVFWTLAIEFQFYLFAALLFPMFSHRSSLVRCLVLVGMVAAAFVWPRETLVLHYLSLFALGVACFQFHVGLISARIFFFAALLCATATAFVMQPVVGALGAMTAVLIAFVRIPRIAALAWLGAVSYSLYLVHVPIGGRVTNLGGRFAATTVSQVGVLVVALSLTLAAAYVMYRFVERPAQRWASSIKYKRASLRERGALADRTAVPTI
jgi:peptidoglycan/LPS O-acetylase OafA/YrhL